MVSIVFLLSSRRRHTSCLSDWSSDVCSSDLPARLRPAGRRRGGARTGGVRHDRGGTRGGDPLARGKIGRASCRERGEMAGGGGWSEEKRVEQRQRVAAQCERTDSSENKIERD